MKLQCQVDIVNRLHSNLNVKTNGKYLKSTLALGKEPKHDKEYFLLHFSSINKTGKKYRIKSIKQVFSKFLNEGKATVRFEEPPHDLCIKCEPIQLKCFLKLLKSCLTGETKDLKLSSLCNITVTAKDNAPTKLIIKDRSEFPSKGLPRTLLSLYINNLKLCNFRRDILLLHHLTLLDLSCNEIEKIPAEFGRMPNLSELYLGNNSLGVKKDVDWKWLLGLQITKKLKLIDLSNNKLTYLPKGIWKLQNLVTLKLDNNFLVNLPATIGRIGSLRYLTISQNQLEGLPCSLIQCRLEHIDLSSNRFHTKTKNKEETPKPLWAFVGNLVNLASKMVLRHKLFYAPNIIPWTLVEFLDNANMCMCGMPVVADSTHVNVEIELKDHFRSVVFDNCRNSVVPFECYFCSPKCYIRSR